MTLNSWIDSTEGRIEMAPAVNSLLSIPSSRKSLAFSRIPCTEIDVLPRIETSVVPLLLKNAPSPFTAPGASVPSWTKLRPLSGRSATCWLLITCPSEQVRRSIRAATEAAVTVVVSVTPLTVSTKLTSRFCWVSSVTSAAVVSSNPARQTLTV